MNIQQMHIEVDLSLQKIASNVKRKFQPDEIDWLLNKQIGRFVENILEPDPEQKEKGFQGDGIDLSAIQTLVVTDCKLAVYKNDLLDDYVLAQLPGNYLHYLTVSPFTVRDCDSSYKSVKPFKARTEYIYVMKILKTAKGSAPYYQNMALSVNGVPTVSTSVFPPSLPGEEMNFVIQDILKNELLQNSYSYKVYWERYKNLYSAETFYFVSPTALSGAILNMDGVAYTATQLTYQSFLPSVINTGKRVAGRVIRGTAIQTFLASAFGKSKWNTPIVSINNNAIQVYHDTKFIVSNLALDYIRKPRLVNLSLGYGCDLPEGVHQKICDLTVEYIKQAIGDPNYQWKLQDNQIRG